MAGTAVQRAPPVTPRTAVQERRPKAATRCAEVAGGAAAVCCCPCGLVSLVVLAAVRLPAGLCRRALETRRRRRRATSIGKTKHDGLLGPRVGAAADDGKPAMALEAGEAWPAASSPSPEVAAMEREMRARFYSTGFWRSPSQCDER